MIQKALLKTAQPDPVETLPDKFISVALDASQIIGGYWWDNSDSVSGGVGNRRVPPLDLKNPDLIERTLQLSPYCIRIGGTEADRLFYSVKNKDKPLAEGYHYYLGKKRIRELDRFCRQVGSVLMITLNAGPGPRNSDGKWSRKNARQLIRYSDARDIPVKIWELGNEVNAYPFFLGLSHRLSPIKYSKDMKKLSRMIIPGSGARTAGPALAVWPVLGETLPFMKRFLKRAGNALDIITWHYYPQQSTRSLAAIRRASRGTLLNPRYLDEAGRQLRKLKKLRDRYQPHAEMWLGETGHALCGGEKDLSDTFYSGFWWLDQIGLMARMGQKQIIRQTLTGGDYGLLDKDDHTPLPDYWTTLLFNRYAGTKVYSILPSGFKKLRFYLHSLKENTNGYCLLFISLEAKISIDLEIDSCLPPVREVAVLTSRDIYSRRTILNGRELEPSDSACRICADKIEPSRYIEIQPLSYGFLILY